MAPLKLKTSTNTHQHVSDFHNEKVMAPLKQAVYKPQRMSILEFP